MQNRKNNTEIIIPTDNNDIISTSTTVVTTTKPVVPVQTFPKQIILSLSNPYTFPNGEVLKVKQIISDSRCAADVQCVWAGNVVVKFTINNKEFELAHTAGGAKTSYTHGEYIITFDGVKSDRDIQSKKIMPNDYSFMFTLSKKEI